MSGLSPKTIVVAGNVAADPAEVWRLWTTSEGMSSWLTRANIELRLDGPFELYFDESQPEGRQGSEGCRVLAFVEPSLLSFSWNAPPHLSTRDAQPTWVVVRFEQIPGGTRVRLEHAGWPAETDDDGTDWAETRVYFERAWTGVLRALTEHCGAVATPSVQGLGGCFLYCDDAAAMADWYRQMLGLELQDWGGIFGLALPSSDLVAADRQSSTTLAFFPSEEPLPSTRSARINLRVSDIDTVLARLSDAGIEPEGDSADDFGRFAWVRDPENNRLELWEPPSVD